MVKSTKSKAPLSEPKGSKHVEDDIDSIEGFSSAGEEDFEEFSGFASTDDEAEEPQAGPVKQAPGSAEAEKAKFAEVVANSGAAAAEKEPSSGRGVLYVGRIPHGFYEDQLREYLSQFGTITRIRISRNKKTGASKHYGFVEFANKEVARIACETMDNYLLFGHLLQVKMMDPKQVHADIWAGANKKFHTIPWNQVNKRRVERKHPREWWEARQIEFDEERKAKQRKLAELGIKY